MFGRWICFVCTVHETNDACWISLLLYSLNPHGRWWISPYFGRVPAFLRVLTLRLFVIVRLIEVRDLSESSEKMWLQPRNMVKYGDLAHKTGINGFVSKTLQETILVYRSWPINKYGGFQCKLCTANNSPKLHHQCWHSPNPQNRFRKITPQKRVPSGNLT